jgi:hypothetical protein
MGVKAGDKCRRCGHVVRQSQLKTATLADVHDSDQVHLTCDCPAGPLGPEDDD